MSDEAPAEDGTVRVQPKRRGRKRKVVQHPSEDEPTGSPHSRKTKQQKSPEPVGSPAEEVDTSGLESPRRSSRRGVRISYLDLLSGVDRSETESTDKGRSSPRGDKFQQRSPKKQPKASGKNLKQTGKQRGRKPKEDNEKVGKKGQTKAEGKMILQSTQKQEEGKMKLGERVKLRAGKQKSGGKTAGVITRKKKRSSGQEEDMLDDIESTMQGDGAEADGSSEQEEDIVRIKDGKFYCPLCEIYCNTKEKMDEHCASKKHIDKSAAAESISLISEEEIEDHSVEDQDSDVDEDFKSKVTTVRGGKYYCHVCKTYCKSKKKMDEHCGTNKHSKKLKAAKQTGFDLEEEDGESTTDDHQYGPEEGITELDATFLSFQDGQYYCELCEIRSAAKKKIYDHCATRKHKKKAEAALDQENYNLTGADKDVDGNDELLQCECCKYATRKPRQFARHLRSMYHAVRAKTDLFPCTRCHRKFTTEEELVDHAIFHDTPKCIKCKETFETFEELEEHQDAENHRIAHSCPDCKKVFSSKGNLVYHMRFHDPDAVSQCHLCDYTSPFIQDMRKHILRHEGYKPYKCSLCDFSTMVKSSLEKHMKTHTVRSKDVECDECGSKFYDIYLLKQHKYVKHNPEYKFVCDFEGCTFAFKFRSSLITHQRMHTQEKPYLCSECGYATSTKYSLTKHIRLHTGEKPFRCDFPNCKYTCRLSTHLSRHKIIHTGAKPFKCPLCSYACNNKQNLRKHLLTTKAHKGVEMYKCKSCDNFSSNSFREYVTHIRKEHGNEDQYITFFQISESLKKNRKNATEAETEVVFPAEKNENYIITEEELQTFSVVTVMPGKEGSRELTNITILDDREYVQQKLEQVILALEENEAEDDGGEGKAPTTLPIQVNSLGELVSIASKDFALEEHGETLVIVPEVQTETEISTTEVPGTVVTTTDVATGVAGDSPHQFVVEIDQSGRFVSEDEMAAATWLHNMGNVQDVTVETILRDVEDQQEVTDNQEIAGQE